VTDDEGNVPYFGADLRPTATAERGLGDFTATAALLRLVPLAVVTGALGAGISLALLDMIGFFTNLFYYGRVSVHLVSPAASTLGPLMLAASAAGPAAASSRRS
jgi:hypothetical protein